MNSVGFVVGAGGSRLGDLASVVGVRLLGLISPAFARYDARKHVTNEPEIQAEIYPVACDLDVVR